MAELATGAVSTLLGVISHEALKLGRVRRDVQFIQEEMESMGSFLANLSGKSREQDEQVRTWMNQVRILANDCNNCIDLYLYRGDPTLHLPKEGPGRYLRWAPWRLGKLLAQHHAAGQLRELKDRAQDIGNRRMRYGVEVKPADSSSSGAGQFAESLLLSATQDHEEEEEEEDANNDQDMVGPLKVALSMTSIRMDKEDHFRRRLDDWMEAVEEDIKLRAAEEDIKSREAMEDIESRETRSTKPAAGSKLLLPSITFVVTKMEDADTLGREALVVATAHFKRVEKAHALVHEANKAAASPGTKDAGGTLGHEDKVAAPLEANDAGAVARQDKAAVPPETNNVGTVAHEDKAAVPAETKETGGAHGHEDKVAMQLENKETSSAPGHEDKVAVTPETKDTSAVAHEDKAVVPPETMDAGGAFGHEDKVAVPPESKNAGAVAHEDKVAVPPETKNVGGALGHDDKVAVPPETKDISAISHEDKAVVPVETKHTGGAHGHEDKVDVPLETKVVDAKAVPPETKDTVTLTHKDKAVPPKTNDATHEDKAVPPKTNDATHEDKVASSKGKEASTLVHEDKVVQQESKEGGALAQAVAPRNVVVLVDVPTVHYNSVTLRPHKILCYILHELNQQQGTGPTSGTKWKIYKYMRKTIHEIKQKIKKMKVSDKIKAIQISNLEYGKNQLRDLQKLKDDRDELEDEIDDKELDDLFWLLIYYSTTPASEKEKNNEAMVAELYDAIIKKTAKGLEEEMELAEEIEAGGSSSKLQEHEYEDILREVFPRPTSTSTTATNTPGTLLDNEIKDIVKEVKEMLHELRKLDKSDKNQETGGEAAQTTPETVFAETTKKKKEEIITKIRQQLKINMMVQKIKECLRDGDRRILVILKVYDKYVRQWEETRKSLSLLGLRCPITGAVIVAETTREDNKQYFGGLEEPIEYSLVGLYFHNVLQKTSHHMNDEEIRKILRNILCECKSDEFCMKIFAHALYAKPKRSREELSKLHKSLCADATQKSLPSMMFKFSYRDLPKEYRSCLLYLAIFPQGQTIRRSTLIGRWVAEGMITTKEWSWSSSVVEAEKCFDTLVARCLVCPAGIGATGKVKSCTVHKLVYGFITKIAKKQHILQTRLSHDLAHHFSIFSDVRLRSSETIQDFLKKSSQFSKLKVLDLEGCQCFQHNQCYLREICRKILMLKYLSLRGTDVTRLPSEINNLHELEVLDIRETKIPASATRIVLLQKLKRLLAGHVDSSPANFSSVQIPEKIEKMEGVEVLSNVKPKNRRDLRDIGGLNELKKLGVAITKESDLQPLLNAISDLINQSLRFLSITLEITRNKVFPTDLTLKENCPNVLESLSINESTSTQKGQLLKTLAENGNQLAKVTLTGTFLSQEHLKILANLEKLCCLKLQHNKYDESKITFNKGEFSNLSKFLVEGNNMTDKFLVEGNKMTNITFDNGAASNLEKIVLSSTSIVSICGVNCLPKLEELELKGTNNMEMMHSLFENAEHIAKVTLCDTMLEQGDLKILASNKKMRYLVLLGKFYNGSHLTFKDEFQKLNLLIVDSSNITEISFTNSSPNLEKIVWSFKEIVSLSGIDKLPALKELELNGGDSLPNKLEEDIKKLKIRLDYKHMHKPKKQEENKREADKSLWKVKDWCWRN